MLPILVLLLGATLITLAIKGAIGWLLQRHTLAQVGYFAVTGIILLLMLLQWFLYKNAERTYFNYLVIGGILGIICGMVPKSNQFLQYKKERWFMHVVTMYFLVVIYAFSALYFCIEHITPGSFSGYAPWGNFFQALVEFAYLSIAAFSTVGFGDICPLSTMAKLAVCAEMLVMFRTLTIGALFLTDDAPQ